MDAESIITLYSEEEFPTGFRWPKTHLIVTGNLSGSPLFVFHGGNATTACNLLGCDFLMKDFHIYAVEQLGIRGAEVGLHPIYPSRC